MKQLKPYLLLILTISTGCSAINETSRHQMETGIYKVKDQNKNYYIVIHEDSMLLHPVSKTKAHWIADTSNKSTILLNSTTVADRRAMTFVNRSFDLDVVTILFKYRPSLSGFPSQLNTNFNGAGYIGHRSDFYLLSFDKNPLNSYQQRMNHFGYSLGFFAGIGSTQMNPFVTNNQVQLEYDGVVLTKGVAGMIGIGNLTFGLAVGFDHLLDKNHKSWIYQAKPWTGFTVGLNLN